MAKAFGWAFLFTVLAAAVTATFRLHGESGAALFGILGLLLFAAASFVLITARISGRNTGTVFPSGVDWSSGLPKFKPHDEGGSNHSKDDG